MKNFYAAGMEAQAATCARSTLSLLAAPGRPAPLAALALSQGSLAPPAKASALARLALGSAKAALQVRL
jgi:hypothetical protein